MILKSAHIKNFRSVRNVQINFETQTAILGANGAGKSTVLKALQRFYGASTTVAIDDFFGKNVDDPIEIALTFKDFSQEELELFQSRITQGEMTVVRVFEARGGKNSGKYFGLTRGHPGFQAVRRAETATLQRSTYSDLKTSDAARYGSLPNVRSAGDIEPHLVEWERTHPDECELIRDDGQFLGFTNVGNGSLKKSTSFVFIPAVRDAASDALDGKGSPIAQLMELVVRNAIQRRTEIQDWQANISRQYRELTDPANLTELAGLAETLTTTLQTLYDETSVNLTWKPSADFEVPLPTAMVSLEDAGYPAPVELQGNGLQRAFILTLLQHLAMATIMHDVREAEPTSDGTGVLDRLTANIPVVPMIPGLILAIEEPELYQHPTKQRHFAKVLSMLSDGVLPGVASKTQVIFASHSPYFISMDRFDQVRLARRISRVGEPHKECSLREAELLAVVRMLEVAHGVAEGSWSAESLKSRLHIVTPELSEGFFADVILLVEGESDKAAFRAAAAINDVDLEALGIAVLQAGGKNNLDRPAAIFMALNVPVFLVWDCDQKPSGIEDEGANRALQQLMGVAPADVVAAGNLVQNCFACFEQNLEVMLRSELGEQAYDAALAEVQRQFGVREKKDAIKAAPVMHAVLTKLSTEGARSATLDKIITRVLALRDQVVTVPDRAC
jgi:putative ATP-dependent endonuclease of the OLD family